jgi:hypothetical protein
VAGCGGGIRSASEVALGAAALVALSLQRAAAAQNQPSRQQTAATLDRMIAAHKSQQDLAQYVFDTHVCKSCHTVGQNGNLGFTARGQQVRRDFEGRISMLQAMTLIVEVPDNRGSSQQRQKAARFQEFGCAFCHKITPGQLGLTDVGTKLTHPHLGSVDVQKLVARRHIHNN